MAIADQLNTLKVRQGNWDINNARSKADGKPFLSMRPE